MSTLTVVEFDHFSLEIRWDREGRFYPASGTSPAECPVPRVRSCRLKLGDFSAIVPFALLPESAQEYVQDELEAEIWDYREREAFDYAEIGL